jgi:structural maintenance of chromosome 1
MSIFLTQELYKARNGVALLTLENPEEPYLAGVRYNVQVPGKRCIAMDCLSGGEAAMASLAFMFALNRCCIQPSTMGGILVKKL